ncbi:TPA: hypothetical protein ACRZEN_002960 [Escherichia coli]
MCFVFIIHDGLRRNLFLSLINKAIEKNINFYIYAFSLREYYWFRTHGISKRQIKLIKKTKTLCYPKIDKCIDVAADFITTRNAIKIYNVTLNTLWQMKNYDPEVYIFGGNGLHAYDKAILEYQRSNAGVYTIFTELSNIDGKVFFDNEGSNASSLFYRKLIEREFDFPEYDNNQLKVWKKNYCELKIKNHIVKQSPKKNIKETFLYRTIGIIEFILRVPSYQRFKIDEFFTQKKKVKKKLYPQDWVDYEDDISQIKKFILFPLQVFGDSQIKLHSNVDNVQALEFAIEKARELNIPLVVKPHPAEPSRDALEKIVELKKKHGFYVSLNNTFELINRCNEILVINSTVGLEAIICGRKVEFLGESFYKYFSDDKVLNFYLNHWLIDMNIFSMTNVNDNTFQKIINIAKLK